MRCKNFGFCENQDGVAQGWTWTFNSEKEITEIQRCDVCEIFQDDQEAREFASPRHYDQCVPCYYGACEHCDVDICDGLCCIDDHEHAAGGFWK